MSHKFWIVEYVDVNAPKVERSEICASRSEAVRKSIKRESLIHFSYIEDFAGRGLCDYIKTAHLFDNEGERA